MSLTVSARAPVSVAPIADGFPGAWLRGDPKARPFLPRHPSVEGDWTARIDEVARTAPAVEVWERARACGERLGASSESTSNARALADGSTLCVTAGQQPGLFLGPLYTVYKAMTAVALARSLAARADRTVVPVFWNAADDSDFDEIGSAVLPDPDFRLTKHSLAGGDLAAGGMVGDLSTDGTARAVEEARELLRGRSAGEAILRHLDGAVSRAKDHGEIATALLYDLFRGTGLVVVDGRWPELRRAAAPLFERYAKQREAIGRAVMSAGAYLEESGYRAPIAEVSTHSALFELRSGRRHQFEGTTDELLKRIREAPETLSPNVMLRPVVQDSLFPNVATVGGPGEVSYHAQLSPNYEALGVSMAILFPRFEATLVPRGVYELAERRGASVEAFVLDFDAAMKKTAPRALPEALKVALDSFEARGVGDADRLREEAASFDAGLTGAVDEALQRAQDAVRKLRGKAAGAARAAEKRRDPSVKHYREFLRPRGVPQERVLSALTLFLETIGSPLDCLEEALARHVEAARDGRPGHWLLDFGGCRDGEAA
jgi:bacillithiol biosynthesis cysteine-adding enzyme BshC